MSVTNNEVKSKNKTMLNTKDMTAGSGKIRPVLDPGNQKIRINEITFDQTPYDTKAYNIVLHVESEPMEGEFQGFLTDIDNSESPRYKGQVGRVRFAPWPYKDAELPSGVKIYKDTEVLKSMIYLAEVLGCRDELDMIEVETIEIFMFEVNKLCSNSDFINTCIASREWESKEGYINHDLYLPKMGAAGIPLEAIGKEPSRLMPFNKEEHVRLVKKKENVDSFEPKDNNTSDFEL